MAGCYGSSAEDRYFERMLDQYTDEMYGDEEEENECLDCGDTNCDCEWYQ